MAHVAQGIILQDDVPVTDVTVREYSYTFAPGVAEAVRLAHKQRGETDTAYVDYDPGLYEVSVNTGGIGGVVTLRTRVAGAIVLTDMTDLRIYRDTEVRRRTSFPVRGYASSASAEVLSTYLQRVLEELTSRQETHAVIKLEDEHVKAYALVGGRPIAITDTDFTIKDYALGGGRNIALGDTDFAGDIQQSLDFNAIGWNAGTRTLTLQSNDNRSVDIVFPAWQTAAEVTAALQPLLTRIGALETQDTAFTTELAALTGALNNTRTALDQRIDDLEDLARDFQDVDTLATNALVDASAQTNQWLTIPGVVLPAVADVATSSRLDVRVVDAAGTLDEAYTQFHLSDLSASPSEHAFTNQGGPSHDNNQYHVRRDPQALTTLQFRTDTADRYHITVRETEPDATPRVRIDGTTITRTPDGELMATAGPGTGTGVAADEEILLDHDFDPPTAISSTSGTELPAASAFSRQLIETDDGKTLLVTFAVTSGPTAVEDDEPQSTEISIRAGDWRTRTGQPSTNPYASYQWWVAVEDTGAQGFAQNIYFDKGQRGRLMLRAGNTNTYLSYVRVRFAAGVAGPAGPPGPAGAGTPPPTAADVGKFIHASGVGTTEWADPDYIADHAQLPDVTEYALGDIIAHADSTWVLVAGTVDTHVHHGTISALASGWYGDDTFSWRQGPTGIRAFLPRSVIGTSPPANLYIEFHQGREYGQSGLVRSAGADTNDDFAYVHAPGEPAYEASASEVGQAFDVSFYTDEALTQPQAVSPNANRWIQTRGAPGPRGPEGPGAAADWKVDAIRSTTTEYAPNVGGTPALAAETWSPWLTLATTAALTAEQVGEAILLGHVQLATKSADSGGDRLITEVRVQRTRETTTTDVADVTHYGPRNAGGSSFSGDFSTASQILDVDTVALDTTQAGDVYTLQVRYTAQNANEGVDLAADMNRLQLASRAGAKGDKGDPGRPEWFGTAAQFATVRRDAGTTYFITG